METEVVQASDDPSKRLDVHVRGVKGWAGSWSPDARPNDSGQFIDYVRTSAWLSTGNSWIMGFRGRGSTVSRMRPIRVRLAFRKAFDRMAGIDGPIRGIESHC